ncbi:hypothetical protein GcC1_c1296o5 [Golovinomyces cichoracearum]|uniref:Uncharacterized protein n=1 Tax=Golovinomyces cichoracearum TaxID=62708 RepID=A0A420J455_9PEZI|nr:hypothetical protein GcC1_c1296o5 [Golovinomyces cichoracearum]
MCRIISHLCLAVTSALASTQFSTFQNINTLRFLHFFISNQSIIYTYGFTFHLLYSL